jgi:hypothetical protein
VNIFSFLAGVLSAWIKVLSLAVVFLLSALLALGKASAPCLAGISALGSLFDCEKGGSENGWRS